MIKSRHPLISVVVIACVVYWLVERPETPKQSNGADRLIPDIVQAEPEPNMPPAGEALAETESGPETSILVTSENCLTPRELYQDPVFKSVKAEQDRLVEPVAANGRSFAQYRGISESGLRGLALQGDTKAMVVLGAALLLRARGHSADKSVPILLVERGAPFLLLEQGVMFLGRDNRYYETDIKRNLSPANEPYYKESRDWFYKAALHGRLHALSYIGWIDYHLIGGPVDLGWADENEYTAPPFGTYDAWFNSSVYMNTVERLLPQLCDMPFRSCRGPQTDWAMAAVAKLAKQFEHDRMDADLPAITIPDWTGPSYDDLKSWVCDEHKTVNGDLIF